MKHARLEWDGESETCSLVILRMTGDIVIHGVKVHFVEDLISDLWDDFTKVIRSPKESTIDE